MDNPTLSRLVIGAASLPLAALLLSGLADCDGRALNGGSAALDGGSAALDATAGGPVEASASAAVVVATSKEPTTIALDRDHVYWHDYGPGRGVYKAPKSGGVPTRLWADTTNVPTIGTDSLSVDATSVYFPFGNNTILAVPIEGGPARTVVSDLRTRALAVANGQVYWVDGDHDGGLYLFPKRVSVLGGSPVQVGITGAAAQVFNMGVGPDAVFASLGIGGIVRIPLGGSSLSRLTVPEAAPFVMAFDEDKIYFVGPGLGPNQGIGGPAWVMPKDGGPATQLAVDFANDAGGIPVSFAGVAVDATSVFVLTADGTVVKVPKGGGATTVLSRGGGGSLFAPYTANLIAVDETSVYWCAASGIMKIAK